MLLSDLIVHPAHSIVKQSSQSLYRLEGNLNGDGFGIGWYAAPASPIPASSTVPTTRPPHSPELPRSAPSAPAPHVLLVPPAAGPAAAAPASGPISLTHPIESSPLCPFGDRQNPCLFNSVTPAWNNQNLHRISFKVHSHLVFAHVRAATAGSLITESNCHPFQWGNYLWMHNGGISGFPRIKRRLLNALDSRLFDLIQGTTDSEHMGLLCLQILFSGGPPVAGADTTISDEAYSKSYSAEELHIALETTIHTIVQWTEEVGIEHYSLLNCALTDGHSVVVSRFVNSKCISGATLYYNSGSFWQRESPISSSYFMKQRDRRQRTHIISSEPLTSTSSPDLRDWVPVPKNSIIVIDSTCTRLVYPIAYPYRPRDTPLPSIAPSTAIDISELIG